MDKVITFVTSNNGKFEDVKRWMIELAPEIKVEQAALDLPEYQSLDVKEVALGKAKEAWCRLQKPVLVDDGGIYLEKYNKFPGTLSKYVYEGIGFEGIWKLAELDPRAYFLNCLVYCDGPDAYYFFEGICKGRVIKHVNTQITHKQMPLIDIFVPDGATRVFAAIRGTPEEKLYNHRFIALTKFLSWLNQL